MVAKQVGDVFLVGSQHIVVERSGCQREFGRLSVKSSDDLRVTVALVHGAVST